MKHTALKINEAAAMQRGAMEPETIQKNGASLKSHTSTGNFKIITILALVVSAFVLTSCQKEEESAPPKKSNFTSPQEFIKNPSVAEALTKASMSVHEGSTPPALEGTYLSSGNVTKASSVLSLMIGARLASVFILSSQTTSGKIDLEERAGGVKAFGSGGYITGANGQFTIYIESKQSGSEAGLPSGISVNVVLIMSGTKSGNGDLENVKGVTAYTEATSSNSSYNVSMLEGAWYSFEGKFSLQEGANNAPVAELVTALNNQALLQKALQSAVK